MEMEGTRQFSVSSYRCVLPSRKVGQGQGTHRSKALWHIQQGCLRSVRGLSSSSAEVAAMGSALEVESTLGRRPVAASMEAGVGM